MAGMICPTCGAGGQRDLFDDGRTRRDQAMRQVDEAANEQWKFAAFAATVEAARNLPTLTADDVQEILATKDVATHEGRAMGPVMMRAKREGVIEATPDFRSSKRANLHAMPKRVWKSLIHSGLWTD